MFKKIVLLSLVYITPYFVHGNEEEDINSNQHWEDFQEKINWFLEYRNPFINSTPSIEMTDDEIKQEAYLIEKWKEEEKNFIDCLNFAHKAFFEFRTKVAEALAAESGYSRYAQAVRPHTEKDLTIQYINFMETHLFPSDWEERYKEKG